MNYTLSPLHFNCCMRHYVSFLNACYVGSRESMRYARGTRSQHSCQSIHSALIHHHPSNSSIIVLTVFTRPQASADAPVCVRAPISSRLKLELRKLARVYESRAPEFLSLQNAAPRCLTSPVGFNRPIISQSLFLNFSCANPATPLAQDHLLGV